MEDKFWKLRQNSSHGTVTRLERSSPERAPRFLPCHFSHYFTYGMIFLKEFGLCGSSAANLSPSASIALNTPCDDVWMSLRASLSGLCLLSSHSLGPCPLLAHNPSVPGRPVLSPGEGLLSFQVQVQISLALRKLSWPLSFTITPSFLCDFTVPCEYFYPGYSNMWFATFA